MGIWGYLPHESDDASDMLIGVDEAVNAHLGKVFRNIDNLNYWRCTGLVVSLLSNHEIYYEFVVLAKKYAERELEVVLKTPNPPKEPIRLISLTIACLAVLLQDSKQVKSSFKKSHFPTCRLPMKIDRNFFKAKHKFQFQREFVAAVKLQLAEEKQCHTKR